MTSRLDRWAPWGLASITFLACIAFMPSVPTEWDSVQLVLGVDHFDVTHDSPHPPGYWLYLFLGRVVRLLTPLGTHAALATLAAGAAAAAVGLTYVVGRRWGGPWLGAAAAAFLLTSPYLLFYGAIPATYTFDAFVAVALVLLASKARPGSWHGWAAAAVLGLGAGLRQSTLVLLGPIALCAAVASVRTVRHALAVAVAGAAGLLVWAVPMFAEQPGGFAAYREYSDWFFRQGLLRSSVFSGAPKHGIVNNLGQASGYTLAAVLAVLPAAALAVVLLAVRRLRGTAAEAVPAAEDVPPAEDVPTPSEATPARGPLRLSLLLWLAFAFPFAFVLLVHFGKAGYVLSYLPVLGLLLLWPASKLSGRALAVASVVLALGCAGGLQRFAFAAGILPGRFVDHQSLWFTQQRHGAPYRMSRPLLVETDRSTRQYLALRREFDPRRDVLVYVSVDGGHRFRHAGWSLPEFVSHLVHPGVRTNYQVDGVMSYGASDVVPVPPGGRAVWVLDVPFEDTRRLVAEGRVTQHTLDTGPTVWVSPPGVSMFGVTVVESTTGPGR